VYQDIGVLICWLFAVLNTDPCFLYQKQADINSPNVAELLLPTEKFGFIPLRFGNRIIALLFSQLLPGLSLYISSMDVYQLWQ